MCGMYVKVVLGEFLLLSRISKVHAHKYFMEQFSSLQLKDFHLLA